MSAVAIALGVTFGVIGVALLITCLCIMTKGYVVVREREVIVVERFGRFKNILTAGVHFVWPCCERKVVYDTHYIADVNGYSQVIQTNSYRLSLQQECLDIPRQNVITRDNALICVDALLYYQIMNANSAKTMVYSVSNLPLVLSRLLQAHIRNIAATLDVDKLIEDTVAMNMLATVLNETTMKWGVRVNLVKMQNIDAGSLKDDLQKKKTADLNNKEVIINARSQRQTAILNAESDRDKQIKAAEGQAQRVLSIARGEASSIINTANAEADAIMKLQQVLSSRGEDPVRYLFGQRYLSALQTHLKGKANVQFLPPALAPVAANRDMGVGSFRLYDGK